MTEKLSFSHKDSSDATIYDEVSLDAPQEVTRLARSVTVLSAAQSHLDPQQDSGPFGDNVDPSMNPLSGSFDYHKWIRWMLDLRNRTLDPNAARTAGLSFTNLNVHGYGKPTDYQKTVGNYIFDVPEMVRGLFGAKGQRIDILRDFQGVVQEGEMLVVLGPPGSGCSTFLKTLSGDTHGFVVDEGARLNYQGIPWEVMHKDFRGEVVYNAENDVHFPNLTVGQTLSFAAKARTPRTRVPGVTREQWANHMKDVIMAVFGLSHTENTKVGNDFVRGCSGGERKRVSIAEVALSGSPLQCWDNSTRGLDSATALEFVRTLRLSTKYARSTAIVAIYQASQDIYDVFDRVTVLYEGRQIYFGRAHAAKEFFVNLGFECPERQTTADFLTSLTNPAERKARSGFESRVPRTPEEFVRAWRESEDHNALVREIEEFNKAYPVGGERVEQFRIFRNEMQAKGQRPRSPYTISIPMQIRLCLSRAVDRLKGDMTMSLTTVIGNFCMSLIVSSIFYNLPQDTSSFYSRSALVFYAVLLAAFASILEIFSLYEQRPIVEKHSRMALYHPATEAAASMICDLPTKLLSSISFNTTLYFMSNLRREAGAFFFYLLISFSCTLAMSMIFRTIGSCTKTLSGSMAPASVIMLALVIYTGFVIPTHYMHSWFRWINRIDPIAYCFESMMLNEFHGREFTCVDFLPTGPEYENATGLQRTCAVTGAEPGNIFVSGTRHLHEAYEYEHSHKWRNFGIVVVFILVFMTIHLVATEFIQAARSKGEVLVFRRGHLPALNKKKDDEETTPATVQEKRNADTDSSDVSGVIQKQTAIFHWEDVCYDIKIKGQPRRILDNVDGWVEPGRLTALMASLCPFHRCSMYPNGATGAGKTTLLDTLANRVTMGVVTGSMFVDGKPRDPSFQRKTGYVQQQDLHLQTSTVREALIFSARLRQPASVSDKEKVEYVDEVIRLLGMEKYADAVVGVPGEGLNVEQRKRLTIGVELAAKPALLLFLDEPTSGLDSQTAWSICTLLRKLANNGQAILCTIHQPSAILFQEFDRLLFLARGGRTVYFGDIGPNSRTLINHFEHQGADPCPSGANPAEWMLTVIGAAPGAVAKRDYPEAWRDSAEYRAMKEELVLKKETLGAKPIEPSVTTSHGEFAASFYQQLYCCWVRVLEQYWRTPSYIYSKLLLCIVSPLFIGFSFWKADNTRQGLQNQMFSIFMLTTIFGTLVNQILPHFVTQRSLYEVRERPSKAYSWKAFMLANELAEMPWNAFASVLVYVCWYYPIGLYRNAQPTDSVTERGGLTWLLLLTFLLFTSTFSHMVIAGIPTAETGGNIAQLMFGLILVFCGVLVSPDKLPGFWIFMYRVSPFTYLVDGLLSTALANTYGHCSDVEVTVVDPPSGQTCGQYLASYMASNPGSLANPNATSDCQYCTLYDTNDYLDSVASHYHLRWRNFGLMWSYIAFNFFAALFIYWLVRVPKKSRSRNA
ncbi:Multidrug resistance protein [Marasmius crinis-equi]|uniref:Multidrug resistance protein n=1 Tax=Marasmius crinis-equi TaxID=585013 RepID=A0ABR3G0F2_9AGAR